MGTDSNYYKEIIGKLDNLTKREYFFYAALGIQVFLIIAFSSFTVFSFLELIARFSSAGRTVLFFLFLLLSAAAFIYLFIRPAAKYFNLFTSTDHFKVAEKVGKDFPAIKDDLLNALQLITIEGNRKRYSPDLIDAAFKNVYNKTKSIRFEKIVDFKRVKNLLVYTFSVIVFCSALLVFVPSLKAASLRMIDFGSEYIPPAKYSFIVEPGNTEITKGQDVRISVKVINNNTVPFEKLQSPPDIYLAVKSEEQAGFEYKELVRDSSGYYFYNMPAVRSSFRYFAKAEEVNSEEYLVAVTDRPVIKSFDVTVVSPSYSDMPQVQLHDNGNVTGLLGSSVNFSISSTKELGKAEINFNDSTSAALNVNGSRAAGSFRIKGDNGYRITLFDRDGNSNLAPISYSVKALYDAYPAIEIISPNKDVNLGNDNRLPLAVHISDDFGFQKLLLHYRLSASKFADTQNEFTSIEVPFNRGIKESDVNYVWNLSKINLNVADVLTYYFEVFDNDNVSGPKSVKSSSFTIRIPALDELLAQADNTQQQAQADMKETLKQAEELKKTLDKIDQDLKKDQKELTWEEKQKIEKALDNFQELQDKMQKIGDQLNNMQQELQKNNLLSKETMEKYMELQKIMDQLSTEEMKKAMEQMQNMLQKMNRDQVQQAMQNMKLDEESFRKSIERTMNLLKRIQAEQKTDELLKRSEEITKDQEEIQQNTKQQNGSKKDELQAKQDQVTKDLDKFEQEMKELAKQMEQLKDLPNDKMKDMQKQFDMQQNQEKSEQAEQQIKQNMMQQAQQNQSQVSQNMQQMKNMIQQMKEQMQQANQMQTYADMMKMLDNLLTLSKQQEQLKNETRSMETNSPKMPQAAQKQNQLQDNLGKVMKQMGDLSQKTFAITPEMGKALGDAQREMDRAIQGMQNRNAPMASMNQGEAMKSLNEAAALVKGSMEQMMQGGGQGGMMSLMQQLQQMGQQQMNLNNLTQQLQQGQQGKFSPEQQAQMQRLAQQQELIRKSVEQLNKEARQSGKSKSLPGNLDNISKEMQEVITNLRTQKLDDRLVQKQEKILSRMLDAQRSINERDFEKERESYTADNIRKQSPAELNLDSKKARDKMKDELNRAAGEGYTRDYEELIRRYFDALQKEKVTN